MISKQLSYILFILLLIPGAIHAQMNKAAINYLAIKAPVLFDNLSFNLSWTVHPAAAFYKQEYLTTGQDANKYNTMLMIDLTKGETDLNKIVSAKVTELKKMKERNPVVNYEVIKNPGTGEYMLDFLLTANAPDGTISIVERNVYRYVLVTDKSGLKAALLSGISNRAYGAAVAKFMSELKITRKVLISKVARFKIPAIGI